MLVALLPCLAHAPADYNPSDGIEQRYLDGSLEGSRNGSLDGSLDGSSAGRDKGLCLSHSSLALHTLPRTTTRPTASSNAVWTGAWTGALQGAIRGCAILRYIAIMRLCTTQIQMSILIHCTNVYKSAYK